MAAVEALYPDAEVLVAGGGLLGVVFEFGDGYLAACAADDELTVLLGVEVEEDVAVYEAGLEAVGAAEALFLVDGEEALDGSVDDAVVEQDCHGGGAAEAVVGAEGGAVGAYPLAVDDGGDGVCQEVVLLVGVLLGHHVHVSLEDDGGGVLVAWCGGLGHGHVAGLVGAGGNAVAVGPA